MPVTVVDKNKLKNLKSMTPRKGGPCASCSKYISTDGFRTRKKL